MRPRKPVPLKRGDTVRIGTTGHTIWTVNHVSSRGWELFSPAGCMRHVGPSELDMLRRTNGVPIAPTVPRITVHDHPGALAVNDLVRFDSYSGGARTRVTWVVRYLDEDLIEISSPGKSHRYLTWLDIERGKLVRANGLPIRLPEQDHSDAR